MKNNYYTAQEAQERLGVDDNRFYYLVRTGKIKKFVPPGRKQGVYLRAEIDKLAREMIAFVVYDEEQGLHFSKATHEDVQEEYELAILLFGNATHDIETRQAWLDKNTDIDFIVRDHGRLVAFISVLPVKHETIMRFMDGEIRGWEIPADDVLPYNPGSTVECIVMSMGTSPEINPLRRAQAGAKLISGVMGFLHDLAQQRVTVSKLYATSATPTGIAILKNAGFREIGHMGKRVKFELDPLQSDSIVFSEYKGEMLTEQGKPSKDTSKRKKFTIEKVES